MTAQQREAYANRDLSYLQEDKQYQQELAPAKGAKNEEEKQDALSDLRFEYLKILNRCDFQDQYTRDKLQDLYNNQGLTVDPITKRAFNLSASYEQTAVL